MKPITDRRNKRALASYVENLVQNLRPGPQRGPIAEVLGKTVADA
jgi:hypothetical protein